MLFVEFDDFKAVKIKINISWPIPEWGFLPFPSHVQGGECQVGPRTRSHRCILMNFPWRNKHV